MAAQVTLSRASVTPRVFRNGVWQRPTPPAREVDGSTLDGATVDSLKQQVHRNGLILEGLRVEQQRLKERQMAQETPDIVEREIQAAATRLQAADSTLSRARAVSLALEHDPDLYTRHELAIQRQRGETPVHVEAAAPQGTPGRSASLLELAIADELRLNPRLTREQAYASALDKNPTLYEG